MTTTSTTSDSIRQAISCLAGGGRLTESEAASVMNEIMDGRATSAQIASFITALRMKGETVDEITGLARVMRAHASTINPEIDILVDTCGTGGDGANTFNISTTAAFVVAGAGVAVAKHGNRAASSKCGSADVLEALGVSLALRPEQVEQSIKEVGMGFLFAQTFHGAMKHAAGPRRELGFRTVFNLLGPLANPANANTQVLGVYDPNITTLLAEVLGRLGTREAYVVHGMDCIDEISLSGPTKVSHLCRGQVTNFVINPEDAGLQRTDRSVMRGGDASYNAEITRGVLRGAHGPCRDVVLLNAAAALLVAGAVNSLREGVRLAADIIDSGRALRTLENLCAYSRSCAAA